MRIFSICVLFTVVLTLASCGGSSQQLDLSPQDRVTAEAGDESQAWVTAWNANRSAFHFDQISTWNEDTKFVDLHSGGIYLIDRTGFTAAMTLAMLKPSLLLPNSSSRLGIWYDSLGDDLE